MKRAPFQVLVLPFRRIGNGQWDYATLRRSDDGIWQAIAGGGEADESPMQAAIREAGEEAGLPAILPYYQLDSVCSIAAYHFAARSSWPRDIYVIPEYAFAVDATGHDIVLSTEHTAVTWAPFAETYDRLRYDSNKTALWELHERLVHNHVGEGNYLNSR